MKPKVYVETSVVSYLTARPSRDIVTAARQELTRQWWEIRRGGYDLYISDFVISEASSGDADAAAHRLAAIDGIPEIELNEMAANLAEALVYPGPLPEKAVLDALHIAAAISGGVDYLLTWNFKHLANATMRREIDRICRSRGYEPPTICTPEELMED